MHVEAAGSLPDDSKLMYTVLGDIPQVSCSLAYDLMYHLTPLGDPCCIMIKYLIQSRHLMYRDELFMRKCSHPSTIECIFLES